jgi:cbb3-type cytochrome oxidase subunit 3
MKQFTTIILVTTLFLITIIATGAYLYRPKPNQINDKQALAELALNDAAQRLLPTTKELILLSNPSLNGVKVPDNVQDVKIRVLTQEEVDALSRVKPVDYLIFNSIIKSDSKTAEVSLSYKLFWRADDPGLNWDNGGKTYYCSKETGGWVINSAKGWVP